VSVPTADHAQTAMVPVAQLHPAPWNPRLIKEPRFKALCKSLTADPAFLWDWPILATEDGTVFSGNMRLRAALHLGWSHIPARVYPLDEALAQQRAVRANNPAGEWQEDDLAALVYGLGEAGADLEALGFDEIELKGLLDGVGLGPAFLPVDESEQPRLDQKAPVRCPECGAEFVP